MEDLETRKARRIEQMVAKWLRRSRDNSARTRASVTDKSSDDASQPVSRVKLTVNVQRDVQLGHYGFEVSQNPPLLITSVTVGSAAEGKLLPGDRILAINNEAAEDITFAQATSLLRQSEESIQFTVLRCISGGPKSSFLTAEKRARLKSNPVKVRFAEEVVVNGHTQGSSLLCMPNVLKVYLENGQTKAFKFQTNTTVKDIILTLKEKLSIRSIDHFALVLEEQYNVLKIFLLHEDELIEQVVQRKESHDYRCLFRVSFLPRDPLDLLQQDPVAFEYLYLQSCSDVLQERFAVEMKCSVALRLAALHIQERIITCAQPQKVTLKYIEKDWGIENFISPTLIRNMRGKDIKKAISFHMKRNQLLLDPRPKPLLSPAQVRLCYLQILGDLKLYGGKIFNATLMLQDRESCIALLVGAKYGISQVVNNKLNIVTMLAEFAKISRLELAEESDKVSMVKIYLQDVKLLTLLLESNCAKDLACLISGYYKLLVDPSSSIFVWGERKSQTHRFSTEEGYESRTGSDSEDSSEPDSSLDRMSDIRSPKYSNISPLLEEEGQEALPPEGTHPEDKEIGFCNGNDNTNDSLSDASDSANTESQGFKTSASSDSLDALEEDDLEACSSSKPEFFHLYMPALQDFSGNDKTVLGIEGEEGNRAAQEYFFSFFPLPVLLQPDAECKRDGEINVSTLESKLAESNVMEYYSLCANISPASSGEKNAHSASPECGSLQDLYVGPGGGGGICKSGMEGFILAPPPGFGDTSSDDEFYDAAERMTLTEARAGPGTLSTQSMPDVASPKAPSSCSLSENGLSRQSRRTTRKPEKEPRWANGLRKRRSFLQTNYTSQVTFPVAPPHSLDNTDTVCCDGECGPSGASSSPTEVSLKDMRRDSDLLEAKQQVHPDACRATKNTTLSSDAMKTEPNALETKSVTDSVASSISAVHLQDAQEGVDNSYLIPSFFSTEKHDSSFVSSHIPDQSCSLPGISFQMGDRSKTGSVKTDLTGASCGVEERCVASTEHHAKKISDRTRVAKSQSETGVSYVVIEEIIHTTKKPSRSLDRHQGKWLSCVPASDQDPLLAEKAKEQLVQSLCERVSHDPTLPKSSQARGSLLLHQNGNKILSENSSQQSKEQTQLGFSNKTRLPSNCEDSSGLPPHLPNTPRLHLGSMVDHVESCQQTPDKCQRTIGQSVPVVEQVSLNGDHLHSDYLNCGPHHLSALTTSPTICLSTERAEDQKPLEKDFTGDALHMDYECNQPSAQEKQRKTDHSNGLGYFSLDVFCKSAGASEENGVSNQTFLFSNATEATESSASRNYSDSPALTTAKETLLPKHNMDKCSCQLTYASCFHGLDNEAELEGTIPVACGTTERPLTTPPPRSPMLLDFSPTRLTQEWNHVNADPKTCKSLTWLPEYPTEALSYLKNKMCASPLDFCHLLDNVVELQEILRKFWGNRIKHSRDKCLAHFSENKDTLCVESQRLTSSCQKVIKTHGPSTEMQNAIQETFQNLLHLTEVCFQFTNCGLCSTRHKDLTVNLRDLVSSYHQFVLAAKQACERGYPSLSVKLLVCQYTALTAALFCLVQRFRASSCV